MNFNLISGDWSTLGADAFLVRQEVFVMEQGVPAELEWDEMDALCIHVLALDETGAAIGTGRLLPDGHVGRMAVVRTKRGSGVGSAMLRELMRHAWTRGDKALLLHAQTHAEPFYVRHGFRREGSEFMEAGIPHVAMRIEL